MQKDNSSSALANNSGSILIVCFFVLVILSMFTLTVGYAMRQKFQVLSRLDARHKLRLIGDAGVQKALYQFFRFREGTSSCDALFQSWSQNESAFKDIALGDGQFSVSYTPESEPGRNLSPDAARRYGLVDEERKIHIHLNKAPEVLRRLLKEAAGLSDEEAAALVDSIRDWQDSDDDAGSRGAESRYYKGLPRAYAARNGKLVTLAELQWVKGMSPEIYEKILPFITLNSSGSVNLNTASEKVLVALGFPKEMAAKIIAFRKGRDDVEATEDDRFFDDVSTVVPSLANVSYLDDNAKAELTALLQSGMFTVKSQHFTAQVQALLKHKSQSLQVTAIFNDRGVIERWEEVFVVS